MAKGFGDIKPQSGNQNKLRVDDLVDIQKLGAKWVTLRFVPSTILPQAMHWMDIIGSKSKEKVSIAKKLMLDKNHDYGEAWREMSQESFVDLILAKILRIKQILINKGKTIISEGIDANFYDIINYAVFGLILIDEEVHSG